jgi:hypothetical protein
MTAARPAFVAAVASLAAMGISSCSGSRAANVGGDGSDDAGPGYDARTTQATDAAVDQQQGETQGGVADAGSERVEAAALATPSIVASGQTPGFVAVDTGAVYWSTFEPPPPNVSGQGQIMECALDGCGGSPTTLWSGLYGINGLTVSGSSLYWPTGAGPGLSSPPLVMACPSSGCSGVATTIAQTDDDVGGFTTDSANAYWTTSAGTIRACALAGGSGSPSTLVSQQNGPRGIAVDATNVYWTNADDGTIATCAIAGCGGEPTILSTGRAAPSAIAVSGSRLFWIEAGTAVGGGKVPLQEYVGGQVATCTLPGCNGSPVVLASYPSWLGGGAMAADEQRVYWSTEDATGAFGEIVECSISGCDGQPTPIARTETSKYPTIGLALGSQAIYWSDIGAGEILSLSVP